MWGGKRIKILNPSSSPPRGAGTKYCPIPTQTPLRGKENPHKAGWGRAGPNCHPYLGVMRRLSEKERERERERERETITTKYQKK